MESKKNYGVVVNYNVEQVKDFINEYTEDWHNTPTDKLKIFLLGAIDFVSHSQSMTGADYMDLKEYAKKRIAELEKVRDSRPTDITIL